VKAEVSLVRRLGRHFLNFFAILLWTGSILSFVAESISPGEGYLYIGAALAAVVILNAAFTFIQEYQSEKIMESFGKMMPASIEVSRGGRRTTVPASEIVPGDIMHMAEGDRIPADGRLIEEAAMKVDHSSLTGESEPQLRKLACTHENILESRNMVFSGTLVQSGRGTALIFGTGMNTQLGRVAGLTRTTASVRSPLRIEIDHFIRVISAIAIILGMTFFVVSVLIGNPLMGSIIFAIGIIVANVPEGLLPTVTLALSMAARRMARNKALIKRLESVETLGSTTVICTDKTGTITENRLAVTTIYLNLSERNVHETGIPGLPGMDVLLETATLCNNARLGEGGKVLGDPTETALLSFARSHVDVHALAASHPRLAEHPFDSNTKRMVTVNGNGTGERTYIKGAPEVVLKSCENFLVEGEARPLTRAERSRIGERYDRLASRGERVIALAYRDGEAYAESDHIFIALVGMIDPPRPEIPEAVAICKKAGIRVIMVTGDYGMTAQAIARRARMLSSGRASVMRGDELDTIDDERLTEFLRKDDIIFARTTPIQKLRVVRTLQAMGEVVTVTGDGVNDAPALKHADMGVAMGLSGTDVAREAADMVLLDDNFATIVKAVEAGRTVFGNIRKFIAYILTSNVPEILPFIAFVLLGIPLPLTVVLILAIDLGTDLLPALGLGMERPEVDVMRLPPRHRGERLLTPRLLFMSYGIVGMIEAAAGFTAYFVVLHKGGWTWGTQLGPHDPLYARAITAFFAAVVICQVANVMNARTNRESVITKGLLSNRLILMGIAAELGALAFLAYSPFAHQVFGTHSLTLWELGIALPFAAFMFAVDELNKYRIRRGDRIVSRYFSA
jgi:sodium/potassium-transporting ATPase subunit alpha